MFKSTPREKAISVPNFPKDNPMPKTLKSNNRAKGYQCKPGQNTEDDSLNRPNSETLPS